MSVISSNSKTNSTKFDVRIANIGTVECVSCSSFDYGLNVGVSNNSWGEENITSQRGDIQTGQLALAFELDTDLKNLYRWFKSTCNFANALEKKDIKISLSGEDGKITYEYLLQDCWPIRWCGPGLTQQSAVEALQVVYFAYDGFQIEAYE